MWKQVTTVNEAQTQVRENGTCWGQVQLTHQIAGGGAVTAKLLPCFLSVKE